MKEKLKNRKNMPAWWRFIAYPIIFMFYEVLFHVAIYGEIDKYIINPVFFAIVVGILVANLTSIFKNIGNAVASYVLVVGTCLIYLVQYIYYRIFGIFLSLVSIGGAQNAMDFKVVLKDVVKNNIGWIMCFVIPVIVLVIMQLKFLIFERPSGKLRICGGVGVIVAFIFALLALNIHGRGNYSPYQLFHNKFVLEISMNKLGVLVTTVKDGTALVFGGEKIEEFTLNEESINIATNTDATENHTELGTDTDATEEIVYGPQIDEDIDLSQLYYSTEDENLKNLTAYFSNQAPTYENEYTGMFEGYNLVFVTAESLSKYGISDTCTPTLNKIMNEGFVFENYYNPLWYHSTIDGEYVNCLGQYPSSAEWSFYKTVDTYQPYALGNALNEEGYASYAYHDYTFYYYNRSETHANMGYDFKAIDYGLEIPYYTPYSDLDTMEAVYEEFISKDKFNMYFMSFSGHLPYNYGYNAMSLKNREEAEKLTEGMGFSEEAVAYIAAQMELDKALGFLIEKLEEAGKLSNTVFVVTPDHYPYGLSGSTYNELAGEEISGDTFEEHRSCLGIWSPSMEKSVIVDKYCASVDVLPTILNLFGVNYDSRLLAGNDILSDSEELVIFSDHSFITDKLKYDASTGEVKYFVDERYIGPDYIDETIEKVENILSVSDAMIEADYFSFVYGK